MLALAATCKVAPSQSLFSELTSLHIYNFPSALRHRINNLQLNWNAQFHALSACRISYLAYIKVFVGLARDRLNGLLASPSATSVAHMRALGLLAWIVTDNATWVLLHFAAFPGSDMTYRLLWLFDPVVITLEALLTASTYGKLLGLSTWHYVSFSCLAPFLSTSPSHV